MRVAPVAAGVLLAHVGDGGLGMRRLDLERGGEGVLGLDRHLVRLAPDPDPDRVLHRHGCSLLLRPDARSRVNVGAHLPKKKSQSLFSYLPSGSGSFEPSVAPRSRAM